MLRHGLLLTVATLALLLPTAASTTWLESLGRARSRALKEDKPILLLSMFGRLDQRWC